jgi:mannose-6-phosphate isomerase-like protein (cupin superfamily)
MINTTRNLLSKDEGVADLWWPFGSVTGRYTIKTTGAQTHGDLVQVLIRDSKGAATPLHVHHDTDETFYVIDGSLTIVIGDERIDAAAGDFVLAPRGVPHAFLVTSETIEMLVTCGPAGLEGGIDGFFREVADPVDGGEPPAPRMPDPELFATRMLNYGIELVGPPPSL